MANVAANQRGIRDRRAGGQREASSPSLRNSGAAALRLAP